MVGASGLVWADSSVPRLKGYEAYHELIHAPAVCLDGVPDRPFLVKLFFELPATRPAARSHGVEGAALEPRTSSFRLT